MSDGIGTDCARVVDCPLDNDVVESVVSTRSPASGTPSLDRINRVENWPACTAPALRTTALIDNPAPAATLALLGVKLSMRRLAWLGGVIDREREVELSVSVVGVV